MDITVSDQLFIFVWCALCGVIIGLIFDLFRISRRLVITGKTAAMIEDIIYWVIASIVFFLFVLKLNSGELRLYQFIGVFLGTGLYFVSVSKHIINISVCIVRFLTKVLAFVFKIILTPILFVYKLLRKPFFLVFSIGKKGGWKMKHKFSSSINNLSKFIKRI